MKKKILALALGAISLSMLVHGSLAYFTAEDTAHNVITSGGVDIEIVEWTLDNGILVPFPKDEPMRVMPGVTASKIVTVENKEEEAYIRARFAVTVKNAAGEVMELDEATRTSIIQIATNDDYWLEDETDGNWFYYKDAVGTGIATEPLLREVVFSAVNMTNEYQGCTVEIDVDAQAVQVANNGTDVLEAAGWPIEE